MNAYLFDVDGVLNNIEQQTISESKITERLIDLLKKRNPLGFISGRGMVWLRTNVIRTLENYIEHDPDINRSLLDLVYVSAEFGGATETYKNGNPNEFINKGHIIPADIREKLTAAARDFKEYVFVDSEKQTIFTVQGNHKINEEKFLTQRDDMVSRFKSIIEGDSHLEVQSDRFAVNVRFKKANKKYATDLFLTWLQHKNLGITHYYVFGDSPSDLEMGIELQNQQLNFEFIYVGESNEFQRENYSFPITITKGHCDEGTLEYFNNLIDNA